MPDSNAPITATIRRFCELTGIGRSKLYQMLDAGEIASVHVGGRRLIVVRSYLDLIERLKTQQPVPRGRK
jgi:excisionase family DNA binding protein